MHYAAGMIVVVGSLNQDTVLRVPHLPHPGETIAATGSQTVSGGKGANQAVGVAKLGGEVTLVGCVGDDEAGRFLRDEVTAAGVTDAVAAVEQPTGAAFICVGDDGENQIVLRPGANAALTPDRLQPHAELIRSADVLLLQLEIPMETVEAAIAIARTTEDGPVIVLDPAPAAALPEGLAAQVDILTPNQTEAAIALGSDDPAALQAVCDASDCCVALTCGADGVRFFRPGEPPLSGEAFPVEAIDTTAAGDAFAAGLAVAIADGLAIDEMLATALAAGSLATTKLGAQPSLPTRAELETLFGSM